MAETNVEKKTEALLKETIERLGYELYDVQYIKEGKEYHLCIFIDKPEGISINDCEKVNDIINPILDEADFISQQYFLEVSSTGLEKNLRKIEHFEKQIGKKIEVNLYSKIDNQKTFQGVLKECTVDYLILQLEQGEIKINFEQIANAKSIFDW